MRRQPIVRNRAGYAEVRAYAERLRFRQQRLGVRRVAAQQQVPPGRTVRHCCKRPQRAREPPRGLQGAGGGKHDGVLRYAVPLSDRFAPTGRAANVCHARFYRVHGNHRRFLPNACGQPGVVHEHGARRVEHYPAHRPQALQSAEHPGRAEAPRRGRDAGMAVGELRAIGVATSLCQQHARSRGMKVVFVQHDEARIAQQKRPDIIDDGRRAELVHDQVVRRVSLPAVEVAGVHDDCRAGLMVGGWRRRVHVDRPAARKRRKQIGAMARDCGPVGRDRREPGETLHGGRRSV